MEYPAASATRSLSMTDSPTPPTPAASHEAEEVQPLLGRIAVRHKMISKDQLAWALSEQSREGGIRKLGYILVDSGLITSEQLQQLVLAQQQLLAQQELAREQARSGGSENDASVARVVGQAACRTDSPEPSSRG